MGTAIFNYNEDVPVPTRYVGDVHKVFAVHCDLKDIISSRNARFAGYSRDIPDLSEPGEENPSRSSVASMGNPCSVTLVFRVPMYSVCKRTDLVVSMLHANF